MLRDIISCYEYGEFYIYIIITSINENNYHVWWGAFYKLTFFLD